MKGNRDNSGESASILRRGAPESGTLAANVAMAFDLALTEPEGDDPPFLALDGMSGRRYRRFVNALIGSLGDARYLEVGVWAGSTLCSAIAGNAVRAMAIDDWSEFGGPRERFLENLARFAGGRAQVSFLEADFRTVDFAALGRFNVYLYDGPHGEDDQHDGLALALPALDSEFVFMVDDWNWPQVRTGTRRTIDALGLTEAYAIELRTTLDDSHPPHSGFDAKYTDWHNGYYLAVVRKRGHLARQAENGPNADHRDVAT